MYEIELNSTPVKIWAKFVDPHAMKEIVNLSTLPFVFHHLAFMPDVHGGKGMPIGGVLATRGVVIPNAVGVDIGCGMCAVKTSLRVEDIPQEVLRKQIMRGIRKQIPLGFDHHKTAQDESFMPQGFDVDKLAVVSRQYVSATKQVGTLGGGNHFIELQKDTEGALWVMIHSGSRNLGAQVGNYYNEKAKVLNRRWFSAVSPDIDMHFLPMQSDEARAYWDEMLYCVEFALCNRRLMMERICQVIGDAFPDSRFDPMINIAHNYAAWENHFDENVIVHRKGATRARAGETGIIPGSQGTKSYIVEGLGNPDSFQSCSHGAGRAMSRTEAVRNLSFEAEVTRLEAQGIVHAIRGPKDLEEAAGAYKDIGEVMANQADLVKIVTELSPVAVIKG
jgi:tRNA-splicing ligase RtcB